MNRLPSSPTFLTAKLDASRDEMLTSAQQQSLGHGTGLPTLGRKPQEGLRRRSNNRVKI